MRELLEQLSPQVYRYLLWLSGQRDAAEDLTQETLLRAWRNRHRLRDEDKVRGWVLRIALNQWRDFCRRKERQQGRSDFTENLLMDERDGAIAAEQKEDVTRTVAALRSLPDRQRDVLYLYACEELTISEIAELLEISSNAVKSSISTARKQMRDRLADVYEQLPAR